MNVCPCCRGQLLRQVSRHRIYWFCPHCWQEMPVKTAKVNTKLVTLVKE